MDFPQISTDTDQDRRSIRFRCMQIPSVILIIIVSVTPVVQADAYEVLVVDIARANDVARIQICSPYSITSICGLNLQKIPISFSPEKQATWSNMTICHI